jgi:hypothetical protein
LDAVRRGKGSEVSEGIPPNARVSVRTNMRGAHVG